MIGRGGDYRSLPRPPIIAGLVGADMASMDPMVETGGVGDQRENSFKLESFTSAILAKRDEAVNGRATSGVEQEWSEDDEAYEGLDEHTRGFSHRYVQTPKTSAPIMPRDGKGQVRSTVFLNITRPYTDAAASRVADMLVPSDDRPWGIGPTPVPRLSKSQVMQLGGPEEAAAILEEHKALAAASAKAMQDEIDDVLNESHWHAEIRHIIEDCARLGSGVIKGPYTVKRTVNIYRKDQGVSGLITVKEIKPASKRIDPWNFFPDPACGERIHDGSYTFEREFITKKQLRGLMGMPGYQDMEIMRVLREGPKAWGSSARQAGDNVYLRNKDQFDMWIFYGSVEADDLRACGCDVEDEATTVSAMCVLVNDRLIKGELNALDTGEFPYDVIAWQRRVGLPWGMGIPRHINIPQRMLNAGVRALMDNAGISSGVQIVLGNGVTPADGEWVILGNKLWRAEADVVDVTKAFFGWAPPSVQRELMGIIEFAIRMAEDTTGLPMLLQGQSPQGKGAETLGGLQLLQANASGVMRRLAKRFDDYVTSPHIRRYYDWMMQYSDKEEIKGDYQIEVRASSALVERDAQSQFLVQAAQLSRDPQFGIDPRKLFAEMAKGQRIDPKRIQRTVEEAAQMGQQPDPVAQAKAILAQSQAMLAEAQAERVKAETVNKSVEAMFSATQSANLMAQNPAIAPVADQLLMSAGMVDKDEPPLVPQVAAPSVPMPENTNPLTPLNPAVGMDTGIEGGGE